MKIAKYAATAATAAALAVTLVACGSGSGEKKAEEGAKAPAQLKVWVMGEADPKRDPFLDTVSKEYEAATKTKVVVEHIPWPQANNKLQQAIASGQGPDVTELGNDQVLTWAAQDALSDVTAKVSAWPEGKDLVKSAVDMGVKDGKTYAVPMFFGNRQVWYRKDLFEKHGVQIPKTWAELTAAAKKIQDGEKGAVAGISAHSDFTNGIASFIWGAGGEIAVKEGDKWVAKLNTTESKAGIKYYTDLVTKDKVAPAKYIGKNELQGPDTDFALGKLAMVIEGPWAKNDFTKAGTKLMDQFASFPIPGKDSGTAPVFAGGSHMAVWKTSKAQDAAWQYLTTLNSKKNSVAHADVLGLFPPFTDLLTGDKYAKDPTTAGAAAAGAGTVKLFPLTPAWGEADQSKKIIPNMIKEIQQGGNFDAAVDKANKALEAELNKKA